MTIYEKIKVRRIELGLSQDELARRLGYRGKSTISKVENGERDLRKTTILKYAKALEVNPSYLLVDEEQENEWVDNFKTTLAYTLEAADLNDLEARHLDTSRLCDIVNGDIPLSFSEACSIANVLGLSVDDMVHLSSTNCNSNRKILSYQPFDVAVEIEMADDIIIDVIHKICGLDYDKEVTMNDVKKIELIQNFIQDNEKTLQQMMKLIDK